MKMFPINSLAIVAISMCASVAVVQTAEAIGCSATLPVNASRRIAGVIPPSKKDETLLIVTKEDYAPPFEKCIRVITCDLDGCILKEASIVSEDYFATTSDPEVPLIGISSHKSKGLWVAQYGAGELQQKFLTNKELDADKFLRKCWLLEVQGKKKLFVDVSVSKQIETKSSFSLIDTRWLYCYTLENGRSELESKILVAEAKTESDEYGVECALADGEVHIWVCEEGSKSSAGLLRVAKWEKDKQLTWVDCYRGKKGEKLRELTVDKLNGSDAAVFAYRKRRWTASCTFCQIKDDNDVVCADLGDKFMSFPAKKQLLRVDQPGMAWLLLHSMRVVVLDKNSRPLREISRDYSDVSDIHLARASDRNAYIVEATKSGHFIIRKVPVE